MRVLITGSAGLLGAELVRRAPRTVEVHGTVHDTPLPDDLDVPTHRVDLADAVAVDALVRRVDPDVVIHTAYSRTEHQVTVGSAAAVAAAVARAGAWLVHLSTDALFDGDHAPYVETDEPSPIHDYGHAKAAAELAVRSACPDAAVIRTSLILRADGSDATSAWVVEALRSGARVRLFSDEIRTPILVDDLADQTWEIVASVGRAGGAGVWHLAGPERLSRVDVGQLLCARLGLDATLIDSVVSPTEGDRRPRDVSLRCDRAVAELSARPRPIGSVAPHG